MRRIFCSPLVCLLSLVSLCALVLPAAALAGPPIEIRFSAAIVLTRSNFQHNQPFDSNVESAGYDIIWRGRVFNQSFQNSSPPLVLFGKGQARNIYKIGGGTCNGNLDYAPEYAPILPVISENSGGVVKMSIVLPHLANNTGLTAMIMDKGQPELSACRTANGGLFSSICFNPTRDCYTLDGSISPGFPTPSDSNKLNKFMANAERAYFEFNDNSPSSSIPFSYTATEHVFDHTGKETDFIKIVWSGFLTISTSVGSGAPGPVDPFTFFGFDPGSFSGPVPDALPPQGNPHKGGADPDFDVRELNNWMKDLGKAAQTFVNTLQSWFGGAFARPALAASVNISSNNQLIGAFDVDAGLATLSGVQVPPASGVLQMAFKLKTKKAAKGFVLKVPKKALQNQLVKSRGSALGFAVDKAARRMLEKGQAARAFFSAKFTSADGKRKIEKRFKFGLKKRKS